MKCSKTFPCYNCSRFSRHCVFVAFDDLHIRASMMGGSTSDDCANHSQKSEDEDDRLYFPHSSAAWGEASAADTGPTPELGPSALEVLSDGMFDADAEDDLMDMGLQIGRLSITERYTPIPLHLVQDTTLLPGEPRPLRSPCPRIGGLFRPGMSERVKSVYDPLYTHNLTGELET